MNAKSQAVSMPRAGGMAQGGAAVILAAILLLLAFRLTASETLRETMAQKIAAFMLAEKPQGPDSPGAVPLVGPAFTAWYAVITWLLAAAAAWLAGRAGAFSRLRLMQLGFLLVIAGLLLASSLQAADRFMALMGLLDVLTSLAAAWTVLVLCHARLLGDRSRQVVIAAVVAILALGVAKALMQKFIEFPDTAAMVAKDPDKALRDNGIDPDDPAQRTAFLYRLKSAEVSGFGALSNVFATQMIADVALLAGLSVAGLLFLKRPGGLQGTSESLPEKTGKPQSPRRPPNPPTAQTPGSGEVPLHVLALIGVGVLLIAGVAVLPMTESKGGTAAAVMALAAVVAGIALHRQVTRHRKSLLLGATVLAVLLLGGVVGYGVSHHGLPTKSLLYRWQYWTATVPMIREHPWQGVGLNNFGDYYLRFKSPAWPEDVRDPHSFFVRFAAEAGVPAMLAIAAWLGWMLWRVLGKSAAPTTGDNGGTPSLRGPMTLGAIAAAAWIPLHFLAEDPNLYTVEVDFLLACLALGAYAAVMALLNAMEAKATRYLALSAVVAALGMLLYDQVNMALVTGPVAMLFWMLLAVGDAGEGVPQVENTRPINQLPARGAAVLSLAVSVAIAGLVAVPLAGGGGELAMDPAPREDAYIRQMHSGDIPSALATLDEAIALSPNKIDLRIQRINVSHALLHTPVAPDIRRVLQLDRSNASLRLMLALPTTDLPAAERQNALQEALAFDAALPPGEAKHLRPEQLALIRSTLATLHGWRWIRF